MAFTNSINDFPKHVPTPGHQRTPCEPANALGARLRDLRTQTGLTQAEFGERVGAAANRVCDHELGRILPTLAYLKRYADAHGMTVSQLLDGVL